MKSGRKQFNCKAHARFTLQFECRQRTAFSVLVILQDFCARLKLMDRLRYAFRNRQVGKVDRPQKLFPQLIIHLLLGFRDLRDVACYPNDSRVQRMRRFHDLGAF